MNCDHNSQKSDGSTSSNGDRNPTPQTQATESGKQFEKLSNHTQQSLLGSASTSVRVFKNSLEDLAQDFKVRTYQLDETKMLKSICCDADPYECLKRSFGQFNKNFARGFIIRLLLVIVQSRKSKKIIAALKSEVPKFGVTLGVTAAFYHSIICLMKRMNKLIKDRQYLNLTKKSMCTLAAFMSGMFLSANLANGEKNLLKLLFYPLAFRCLSDKLLEIGLVP